MHKSNSTYTTTKMDQLARDFVESLGALRTESSQYILGRKGEARRGKFKVRYQKGVCLNSGIATYAYTGIEIKYQGRTVYNHQGDNVERVTGKWESELAALPPVAKAPPKRKPGRPSSSIMRVAK